MMVSIVIIVAMSRITLFLLFRYKQIAMVYMEHHVNPSCLNDKYSCDKKGTHRYYKVTTILEFTYRIDSPGPNREIPGSHAIHMGIYIFPK